MARLLSHIRAALLHHSLTSGQSIGQFYDWVAEMRLLLGVAVLLVCVKHVLCLTIDLP